MFIVIKQSSRLCEILLLTVYLEKLQGCPWAQIYKDCLMTNLKKKKWKSTAWQCWNVHLLWDIMKINDKSSIITPDHCWGICFVVCHDCPVPTHKVFLAMALRVRTLLTSATFRPYSGAEKVAPIVTQVFLHMKILTQTATKKEENIFTP